jgi:hypothetical protein
MRKWWRLPAISSKAIPTPQPSTLNTTLRPEPEPAMQRGEDAAQVGSRGRRGGRQARRGEGKGNKAGMAPRALPGLPCEGGRRWRGGCATASAAAPAPSRGTHTHHPSHQRHTNSVERLCRTRTSHRPCITPTRRCPFEPAFRWFCFPGPRCSPSHTRGVASKIRARHPDTLTS